MFNQRNIIIGVVVLLVLFVWIIRSGKNTTNSNLQPNKVSAADQSAQNLYEQAVELDENQAMLEAKAIYQNILNEYPEYENIEQVQKRLEDLNMNIIFSNTPTPQTIIHDVKRGDTLGKLAKKYGTTIELIKKNNHLKNDIIRIGAKLRVWTGTFNIFVDKSQNILYLKQGDEILKVYDVSTGKNSSTPVGEFRITSKLVDPVWFNRGVIVPPESPRNVLGSRWLGFNIPGYGIHGTVEPETIGQAVTAGCVRMRNEDVQELYSILPMKVTVVVVD